MKKILVFAGSLSKTSINKQLAVYAAKQFQNAELDILDLNDYEMPVFSVDKEKENGIHNLAHDFYNKIGSADLIVLSLAEHNGAYSSAFKNILDWTKNQQQNLSAKTDFAFGHFTRSSRWRHCFRHCQ